MYVIEYNFGMHSSVFTPSPGRGRSGMRMAWGGEIGGTGVDKYGSPGTDSSVDRSFMPIIRPTSSVPEGTIERVK